MASKFRIVGNEEKITKDVKDVINYLENIVINKDTLQEINTAELVDNINKAVQCVEVLSEYKKPVLRLINAYNRTIETLNSPNLTEIARQNILARKIVLEELLMDAKLEEIQITRKDYWKNYE